MLIKTFMQKKLPIKDKILQYLNLKGVTRYKFYKETGITRGILDQKNGITEDNLLKFINYAQDISLDWLFLDSGSMLTLREHKDEIKPSNSQSEQLYRLLFIEKEKEVKDLNREIGRLEAEINNLKQYNPSDKFSAAAEPNPKYKGKKR